MNNPYFNYENNFSYNNPYYNQYSHDPYRNTILSRSFNENPGYLLTNNNLQNNSPINKNNENTQNKQNQENRLITINDMYSQSIFPFNNFKSKNPFESFLLRSPNLLLEFNIDLDENIEKILDEYKKKEEEKNVKKEYKWLKLEINTLEELIELSKEYGTKYGKEFEYNIDLNLLSTMTKELEELNKLVGLEKIKKQIVDIILFYALKLDNINHDLLHTVIEGEPGTGKTELAEKIGKIYLKLGILKNDVFKKVKRSDLIAGYLGQTAIKTARLIEECKGGVLFIDEAYSLGNSEGKDGKDSFSKECIDVLNQSLTENKNNFVCIIAGYKEDLEKSFFSYNSGLERRFPIRFSIDKYSDEELSKIFIKKVKENEWDIAADKLLEFIKKNRIYFKFNGGDMEILFAKCKISHSKQLLLIEEKKKKVITDDDIENGLKIYLDNPNIKNRDEKKGVPMGMYC